MKDQVLLLDRRNFIKTGLVAPLLACGRTPRRAPSNGSVVVIGAGLSGLCAALLLEERGVSVAVLEARDRLGGRIHTLDEIPGRPEAGGPVVGGGYRRFRRMAEHLQVDIEPLGGFQSATAYSVNDRLIKVSDWPSSPANRLAEHERRVVPPALLGYYMAQNNPFESATDWLAERHGELDIPLDAYLRSCGASAEAIRLIGVAPNTNDIRTSSALWALKDAQRAREVHGPEGLQVRGGGSRFIEMAAAAIQGPIRTEHEVTLVRSTEDHVEVTCSNGSVHRGDFAVVTLPFSVLRKVEIDPPLEGAQKEAVEELPYTAITKYFLTPRQPFWETDGHPATMWTDTIIERIFAMQDASGRIVTLVCWIDGANALKLDSLPEEEQKEIVKNELARIRPSTRGNVDVAGILSWGKDPFAGGAYAHYSPGQVTRLKPRMGKPWKRIHFAGEHVAVETSGLESALESAERAAAEVLERIKKEVR
jgi:monoamine oxidase